MFCSDTWWTPEHRLRLRFAEAAKRHFGDRLDWFGNGINPLPEKWPGLAPYKYSIVMENKSSPNVITEKIQDAYLALSYPLYWGAPNVGSYFPPGSFSPIDVKDHAGSIRRIEEILDSDPYDTALPALRQARDVVLNELNFVARLARYAEDVVRATPGAKPQQVSLRSIAEVRLHGGTRLKNEMGRFGRLAQRLGERLQKYA